ncbi:PREDICTED: E3 ubiquitin-protein ligase RHF1A-like [Populus euphratica]|uniref:E3 ubiquitin-protein ligase RHF1A-like n=1 Tax=Populus euphratica TaxID=75702 RepID=A0AAJ6U7W6_POPEU|nr:PREDICTED: E3 ubiquitin-protein ligase RHF1A-like [Populus euphratica]
MTSVINIDGHQSLHPFQDQVEMESKVEISERACGNHGGICAICLDKIVLQETALIKGCEHAYCVTCILRWSTYTKNPTCPQCKHPFEFLNVHRSLDGSIQDYMFEESVCLLRRASWFVVTLTVEDHEDVYEDPEDYYPYEFEDEDDDLDEVYLSSLSNLRIGNRRWGDNGYVRAGHQEARPVYQAHFKDSGASTSREPKKKEAGKDRTGRRAKRTLKREAADKAAASKHQQHLARLGRK